MNAMKMGQFYSPLLHSFFIIFLISKIIRHEFHKIILHPVHGPPQINQEKVDCT